MCTWNLACLAECTVVMVNTHRLSRQTRETTLSTLSRETYASTLSNNTWGSGETTGALRRMTQWPVSRHITENRSLLYILDILKP